MAIFILRILQKTFRTIFASVSEKRIRPRIKYGSWFAAVSQFRPRVAAGLRFLGSQSQKMARPDKFCFGFVTLHSCQHAKAHASGRLRGPGFSCSTTECAGK